MPGLGELCPETASRRGKPTSRTVQEAVLGTTQCAFGTTQCDHVPSRHSRIYSDKSPKIHAAHTPPETPDSPCFIGRGAYPRETRHKNVCRRHPSMTKKFQIFCGRVSRRAGRAWGGRMRWTHEVGESGRHAPRAARVLRAPGRGWGGRGLGRDGEPSHICRC